jgi:nucleotide-binding universal stress UspA family protein
LAGAGIALAVVRVRRGEVPPPARRVLFPFSGTALSERALDAALRLARAEGATLVPVYLAPVPMAQVLDAPLPRTCGDAFAVFEAIEHRAARAGVPVDARIERGRTARHALREAIERERYDRIVVPAAGEGIGGFGADDVAWLLRHAPGEVVVFRPGDAEALELPPSAQAAEPPPPPRRDGSPSAPPAPRLSAPRAA